MDNKTSFYIKEEDQARIERLAEYFAQWGVNGLYHIDGSLNKSAFLHYLLVITEKDLKIPQKS